MKEVLAMPRKGALVVPSPKGAIVMPSRKGAIQGPDALFLEQVSGFIEENIMEPELNVEALAAAVFMSRMTLYRKIKGLTNQTVIEFIRGYRLKKAAQLLAQNEYMVNEVAYMVGFSDVDYFRKGFKQRFGATPKEYAAANHLSIHIISSW